MMKFLSILVAASLALTPAIASAGSHAAPELPAAGPTAGDPPDRGGVIPLAAPAVLGVVALGTVLIILLAGGNDSNNNTNGGNGVVE